MKIIYRKDLNMPRGKVIAQASHAVSALLLGCYDFKENQFKSSTHDLENFIKKLHLEELDDSSFFNHSFLIEITDNGKTVFNGLPTLTCGLLLESDEEKSMNYFPNLHAPHEHSDVRLMQIIDKDFARQNFHETMKQSVIQQNLHLLDNMQNKDFIFSSAFQQWYRTSFTKLVLVSKDNFLNELKVKNLSFPISWNEKSCVIGPVSKESIQPYTQHLKMM